MASGRVANLLLVAVFLGAAFAATAVENEYPGAHQEPRDTTCWDCHSGDNPPIRTFSIPVMPDGLTAANGDAFDYSVRIENGWDSPFGDFLLIEFAPALDISAAPSLSFQSAVTPILGEVFIGELADVALPATDRFGNVTIQVEPGATDLRISLSPLNQDPLLGPDMELRVYPAQEDTEGNPAIVVDAAGPGSPEELHIQSGSEIAGHGFGNWTIEASMSILGVVPPPPSFLGDVDFSVTVDRYFNASEERIQHQHRLIHVPVGGSTVFTWPMEVIGTPGPGESVLIYSNVTSYYVHNDGSTPDFAWVSEPTTQDVLESGGGVRFGGTATVIAEPVGSSISMDRISEVVGYIAAFLVVMSIWTGGMFGKASRRQLNKVFQSAKRRVAFHNALSYLIILASIVHMMLFLWNWPNIETRYHWTVGLIWGSLSILGMFGLGLTGALQVPMIRRWNYALWKWTHWGMTVFMIVFTLLHIFLDGGNFGNFQSDIGWSNPLDPRDLT